MTADAFNETFALCHFSGRRLRRGGRQCRHSGKCIAWRSMFSTWMNDRQFADVFAISQLSPAPCRRRGAGLCHAVWVLLVLSDENR
jgi:hypothetical protein